MAVPDFSHQHRSPDEAPPAYFIARTAVPGSTVTHLVTGHFRRPGTEDAVLCKENALELLCNTNTGSWESLCEQDIYGSVVQLSVLPCIAAQNVRLKNTKHASVSKSRPCCYCVLSCVRRFALPIPSFFVIAASLGCKQQVCKMVLLAAPLCRGRTRWCYCRKLICPLSALTFTCAGACIYIHTCTQPVLCCAHCIALSGAR